MRAIYPNRRKVDDEPSARTLDKRGSDGYGSGTFGASRGSRLHQGIDFAAPADALILSPVDGKITKLGYPYGDDLTYRYVEITTLDGLRHRVFYVSPCVKVGDHVHKTTVVGECQDIAARYNKFLMVNHVHYEVMTIDGLCIDPESIQARGTAP